MLIAKDAEDISIKEGERLPARNHDRILHCSNVRLHGITLRSSPNWTLHLQDVEGAALSDLQILNVAIGGNTAGEHQAKPIYITVQARAAGAGCGTRVRNVVFNNVTAESENRALLWGGEGSPTTGVELNAVRLHMIAPNPALSESIGGNIDLRWTAVTPRFGVVKSDIPAVLAKKVNGLRARDTQVDWSGSTPGYSSDGLRVEDFQDLSIDSFSGCLRGRASFLNWTGSKIAGCS